MVARKTSLSIGISLRLRLPAVPQPADVRIMVKGRKIDTLCLRCRSDLGFSGWYEEINWSNTDKVGGESKEVNKWVNKYLGVGEWVMDQSIALASSSSFFERTR